MMMGAERNSYSSEVTRLLGKTEQVSYAGRGRVENNRYPSKPSPSPSTLHADPKASWAQVSSPLWNSHIASVQGFLGEL